MLVANAPMEEGIRWRIKAGSRSANVAVANALFLRGPDLPATLPYLPSFVDPALYAPWTGAPHHGCLVRASRCGATGSASAKSATLLTNSAGAVAPLAKLLAKADAMMDSRAYLHHYAQHGVSADDLVLASLDLAQVVADYSALTPSG